MRINNRISYYLFILIFPVSFLLHGINENFGLIGAAVLINLLFKYIAISLGVAIVSKLIFRDYPRAFLFSIITLLVYFLFGAFKDFFEKYIFFKSIFRYKFLLPLIVVAILVLMAWLKRATGRFQKISKFIMVFLLVNLGVEACWGMYQVLSAAEQHQDFGDYHHTLLKDIRPHPAKNKPTVFWLVFDEYAASSTLQKVWHFTNPLDQTLRTKGFYVADSAKSNYNFTHYSITSTLDMVYLKGLSDHSVVTLRDLSRGTFAIHDNNVLRLFEDNGYVINNYTIFQLKGHPTKGMLKFGYVPKSLIENRTMSGKIKHDIGWNFTNVFSPEPRVKDSLDEVDALVALDKGYHSMLSRSYAAISSAAAYGKPSFFMFHLMLPHEPFIYDPRGALLVTHGFNDRPEYYIDQVQYTNTIINRLVDTIRANYRDRDFVILVQGDHGFKFKEHDPLYDRESCSIMYAVYCSDLNYSGWYRKMSAVNGFRVLFNKYFQTALSVLPDTSFNLLYRVD